MAADYNRRDHFHQRAKREGYRSRAAFKLLEIHKSHKLLRRGIKVIDLGCWPGGWLQVASRMVGANGRVVGVDIAAIDPPLDCANVVALSFDLAAADASQRILGALGGPADLLLSDAAPKLTGIRASDQAREGELLERVEGLLPALLAPRGTLLMKILEGPDAVVVDRRLRSRFQSAKTVKPKATRRGSAERYLLATGYKTPTTSSSPDPSDLSPAAPE
jgi:23S rRNA (uridine2552-2'-O)-methyltransferase